MSAVPDAADIVEAAEDAVEMFLPIKRRKNYLEKSRSAAEKGEADIKWEVQQVLCSMHLVHFF